MLASSEGPWTPGETGVNPDITSHKDIPDDATVLDFDAESLKAVTDLLRDCGEEEAADEIDKAFGNGSVKFQEFHAPGVEIGGTHLKEGDGDTVGLNTTMGEASRAAVLLHEWEHVKNRNGYGDEPPTTQEEEDPCNHAAVHQKGYDKLRDFMADARNGETSSGAPPPVDITPSDEGMAHDMKDNLDKDNWDCMTKYHETDIGSPIGSNPGGSPNADDPPQDDEGCD